MFNVTTAIEELEKEIEEKQRQIEKLKQFNTISKNMSEITYHELCETDMRCSDELGKALVNIFPFLEYRQRGCNYFFYNVKDTDYTVRIPNSRVFGIEICVDEFHMKNEKNLNTDLHFKFHWRETELLKEIEQCSSFVSTKNIIKRAKIAFPYYRTWFALLLFIVKNPKHHYEKEYKNKLETAKTNHDQLTANQVKFKNESLDNCKKQTEDVTKMAESFLEWTNRVRVCKDTRTYASIEKKNGQITIDLNY